MTTFQKYNISDEEVWRKISEILEENRKFYKKVRIRCVAFKDGKSNDYYNILSIINFTTESYGNNRIVDYGQIFLFECWYDIKDFNLGNWINSEKNSILLRNLPPDQLIYHYGGDIGIKLDQSITFSKYSFESFDNDYSKLSGYLFTSNNRLPNNISGFGLAQPLLSYKYPLFMSCFQAIQEWTELKNFYNDSDGRLGNVIIFLPNAIAGFDNINKIDGKLKVISRLSDDRLKSILKVKVLWIANGQRINQESEFKNEIIFDIPEGAESAYIYLMDSNETVYDYYQETLYWTHIRRRIIGVSKSDEDNNKIISNALQKAENENTEFKPFIEIGDNNKWNEIIKTVIAFMNTHGGNIIIGVNDEVYVEGIKEKLKKEYYKNNKNQQDLAKLQVENEQIEWYKGIIKNNIANKLSGTMRPVIEHTIYDNHTLIIVKAPEGNGNEKPYYNTDTKDIYVRKGANNKKPDPHSELPELLKGKLIPQNLTLPFMLTN